MTTLFTMTLSKANMKHINHIAETAQKNSSFVYDSYWGVNLDTLDHNQQFNDITSSFVSSLFSRYSIKKLSTYKKIFDYCFQQKIDLPSIFQQVSITHKNNHYTNYPEWLELIYYAYKKNYFQHQHDFYPYFISFKKPFKSAFSNMIKLLSALSHDCSEKSFHIHLQTFNNYSAFSWSDLDLSDTLDLSQQQQIKVMFDKFKHQPFYDKFLSHHQKFYPSLLQVKQLSDFQEDSFFSTRFSFTTQHCVVTLQNSIENNVQYIYNTVFQSLKEKDIIQDYSTILEQPYFYLYVFTSDPHKLTYLNQAVKKFHTEIQLFLQNNTQSDIYFTTLFDTFLLHEKLRFGNKNNSLPSSQKHSPLKI